MQAQAPSNRPPPVVSGLHSACVHQQRHVARASDEQSESLTPEEAAIYEEVLARRRSERQQAIQEAKRRSRFNPLQGKAGQQPAGENKGQHGEAKKQPPAPQAPNPATANPGVPGTTSKQASVRPQPTSGKEQAVTSQASSQSRAKPTSPSSSIQPPSETKNERAARSLLRQGRLPKAGTAGLARRAAALAQQRGRLRSSKQSTLDFDLDADDDSDDEDDQIDQAELAALDKLAQQLLAGTTPDGLEDAAATVPVRGSTTRSNTKASPASSSAAVDSRSLPQQGAAATAGARKQRLSDLNDPRLLAQLQALMDEDSDSDDEVDDGSGQKREKMVNMDDIDWDALEAYESFEASLESGGSTVSLTESDILVPSKVKGKAQPGAGAGGKVSVGGSAASKTSAHTFRPQPLFKQAAPSPSPSTQEPGAHSSAQSGSQPQQRAGSQPPPSSSSRPSNAAGGKQQGSVNTPSAGASSQKPVPQASSSSQSQQVQQQQQQQSRHQPAAGSQAKGQAGAKAGAGQPAQGKAAASTASSSGAGGGDEGMDLAFLEELLLGKDWQERELGDLVSKGKNELSGGSSGPQDDGEEVWGDEVTSMLVSLVLMSHKRYCKEPLLPEDLPEEQRARAMWEAPYVVLVQDDSKQAMLEYANKEGLKMLGITDFVDIYDLSYYSVVDSSEEQQQEWLWAVAEAEDKPERRATIPRLRFVQRNGSAVEAKNAVVFRIDSLEGGPVGLACVIRDWKVVA